MMGFLYAAVLMAAIAQPVGYLHCIGNGASGSREHTITLYADSGVVDGTDYNVNYDDQRYVLATKNYMADAIPGAAAILLMDIDRVTGRYEISAGPDNPVQHETGLCVKARRKL